MEFEAVLKISIVLPSQPVPVGVKLTVRLTLCPAGKASGRFRREVENWALPTVIPLIVTLVGWLFVKVARRVSVWPVATPPNRRFEGEDVSCSV